MTLYFNLQIPAGIEKARLPIECEWLRGDFHGDEPELKTSKNAVALASGFVELGA
jgi:hypothetical protein